MFKWVFAVILLLLFTNCGSESSVDDEAENVQEESIRIYSDSIGWAKKARCQVLYAGTKYKAKIKFRGGISSKYSKHSMTMELKKEVSLGGLPQNDDWVLNASYVDKTFLRHRLSYSIFRSMDEKNKAPKCTYLPVYLNDKYIGLYVIMEKVNRSWLGFDSKNPQGARLFKDPFVFVKERLPNVQEPDNYYQQKFPKIKNGDFNSEMDAFKVFLFQSDDTTFVREYRNWVDEESLLDWHLLLLLTNNDDGIIKNFYLYKEPNDSRLKFIPWDYDHSFGRDGNYELNLIEREVGWKKVILLRRLMELPESGYAQKLKGSYEKYRETVFSEATLLQLVNDYEQQVRPFIKENAEKWPVDSEWYLDANDFDAEVEIIRKYIPMRLKQLDDFFSTLDYGEEE